MKAKLPNIKSAFIKVIYDTETGDIIKLELPEWLSPSDLISYLQKNRRWYNA